MLVKEDQQVKKLVSGSLTRESGFPAMKSYKTVRHLFYSFHVNTFTD